LRDIQCVDRHRVTPCYNRVFTCSDFFSRSCFHSALAPGLAPTPHSKSWLSASRSPSSNASTHGRPRAPVTWCFWTTLRCFWPRWFDVLLIVKPETVIGWHRAGFRLYWRWRSRSGGCRPRIAREARDLIVRLG
jgi:hypothetical protein